MKWLNIVFKLILSLFLVIIIVNRLSFNLKEFFYVFPREYRDGAIIDIANMFSLGKNPWSISQSLPHTYTYGFIPPLLISFFYLILGKILSFSYILKLINFGCLFAVIFFTVKQISKYTNSFLLKLLSIAFILIYNFVSLRPELIAVALNLFALYLATNSKKITIKKIFLLSFISVILFFVKQYFAILSIIIVVFFSLFKSKKDLITYLLFYIILMISAIFFVNIIFPLYFPHTLINHINLFNTRKISQMTSQFIEFFSVNILISITFIMSFLLNFRKFFTIRFDIKSINKPLFKIKKNSYLNIYFFSSLINIAILIFPLGQHTGTYMTYFYQLLPIPLIIYVTFFINKITKTIKYREYIIYIFVTLFIINYKNYLFPIKIDYVSQNKAWNEAIAYIEKANPKKAYLTPHFTIQAIEKGWSIYDNGQTEFYFASEPYQPNQWIFRYIFPSSNLIRPTLDKWKNMLNNSIIEKKFSLIVVSDEWNWKLYINETLLKNYYQLTLKMEIPINLGKLSFYKPK